MANFAQFLDDCAQSFHHGFPRRIPIGEAGNGGTVAGQRLEVLQRVDFPIAIAEYDRDDARFAAYLAGERFLHFNVPAIARFDEVRADEEQEGGFQDLARKAAVIPPKTILSGWLFRAARFAGANVVRSEFRRKRREWEAAQMEPTVHELKPDQRDMEILLVQNGKK